MMEDWRIVSKDGNPEAEGIYDCVLIYDDVSHVKQADGTDDWVPTGIKYATRDSRFYGDAVKHDITGWVMKDQPKEGLVWTEETGSYPNERVYAWLPFRMYPEIELPDGIEWRD